MHIITYYSGANVLFKVFKCFIMSTKLKIGLQVNIKTGGKVRVHFWLELLWQLSEHQRLPQQKEEQGEIPIDL